jgi:hypothetical protein
MLICKVTGFIGSTRRSPPTGINKQCREAYLAVSHGKQKYITEVMEMSSIGNKCFFSSSSSTFEIIDSERVDPVEIQIFVRNSSLNWTNCASVTLSMPSFRSQPEQRQQKSSTCKILVEEIDKDLSLLDAELGLSLVYTNDVEHPSVLNFLACGLFMCPGAPTIPSSSTNRMLRRNESNSSALSKDGNETLGDEDEHDDDILSANILCGSSNNWPAHHDTS